MRLKAERFGQLKASIVDTEMIMEFLRSEFFPKLRLVIHL